MDSVIIDAGYGKGDRKKGIGNKILSKINTVLNGTTLKAIFITHPHEDHYNLIPSIPMQRKGSRRKIECDDENIYKQEKVVLDLPSVTYQGARIFLGGRENDWKKQEEKKRIKYLNQCVNKGINYTIKKNEVVELEKDLNDLMTGVNFEIIAPQSYSSEDQENKLSLIIKVTYEGKSILFTGDAEQSNFDNLGDNKEKLNNLDIVFLPHHGSESSDQWMNAIKSLNSGRLITWFISSSPEGAHGLPQCTVLNNLLTQTNESDNEVHALSCREDKTMDNYYKCTKKPFYITGTAPGGVYWLRVSENKTELYNAYPEPKSAGQWEAVKEIEGQGWKELNKQDEEKSLEIKDEEQDEEPLSWPVIPDKWDEEKSLKIKVEEQDPDTEEEPQSNQPAQEKSSDQSNPESEDEDSVTSVQREIRPEKIEEFRSGLVIPDNDSIPRKRQMPFGTEESEESDTEEPDPKENESKRAKRARTLTTKTTKKK